jgi:hypothetical protein
MQILAFRTLGKRWLLSLTSLPPGETKVREQAAEIFFSAACQAPVLPRPVILLTSPVLQSHEDDRLESLSHAASKQFAFSLGIGGSN